MVKLSKEEKDFLYENIVLFESNDINYAVCELANRCKAKYAKDEDFYNEVVFGDLLEFLAAGTDLFDHLTDETCKTIMSVDDDEYIPICRSYKSTSLRNNNIKTFKFCVDDRGVAEIDCPNVEAIEISDADAYIFDWEIKNPKCVIRFPKLKTHGEDSEKECMSICHSIQYNHRWPNDLYLETNAKAAKDIIATFQFYGWGSKQLDNAKQHIKVI